MAETETEVDHPWVTAAEHLEPDVLPAILKTDPVTVTGDEGPEDYVLLTTATGAGVNTIFIAMEMFAEHVRQGMAIMRAYEAKQTATGKKLEVVSPQQFKRDQSLGRLTLPGQN
jgi:hypothetical protein